MSIPRCLLVLAAFMVSSLCMPKHSSVLGDEWRPIDPAELKMTGEPKAPGAPAIFLYRQVDRNDTGRANTEINYVRIKILTEEGRKYANVEIPYLRSKVAISSLRARTVHPDGSVASFDGKTIDQTVYKAKGVKYLAKTFTMPDVTVGSIIEYYFVYDLADGYLFNSQWILSDELFTKKAVFSLKPYEHFALRWSWPSGLPRGTEPPKQDPMHIVRMTAQDIPAFQIEDFMPPANELKFRIDFVYKMDFREDNPDEFWKSYGKKRYDHVESFINKPKAMQQALSEIVSPGDPPETKLRKIYARCQRIRNLSYETSKTQQEAKRDFKRNQNVEDLWKNGYGDGFDITWLFLALARAAGFEAYPVMVSMRSEYFFNFARMNSNELNANVVQVKLDGKDSYYDPGAAFVPFGLLPWPESGVDGRRLDKDGGTWVQTTMNSSAASKIQRKAQLKLSQEGALEGTITVSYTGLEALSRRLEQHNEDAPSRKKFLEDELKEVVPAAADVELKNQPDWSSSEQPLVAEYEVKIDGWASAAGHRAILPVGLFSTSEKHIFEHADRVQPIYFPYFYSKDDDINIELPSGWQVTSVPKTLDKDAKAAEYTLKVDDNKTVVHISRTLRSDLFIVPKDTYPALRTFFETVRTGDDQQVVLEPGSAAAGK